MVKKEVLKFRKLTLLSNLGHNIKVEGSYFVHNPPPQVVLVRIYLFIYLFLERGEGREEERERNINMWLPLECPLPGT